MMLAESFSFPQGDDLPLVLGSDHNGLCVRAQTLGLCPLRDSENVQPHPSCVHTGKTEGMEYYCVLLLSALGCDNGTRVTQVMLIFLVATCNTPLFDLLIEA